jgi:hypothetical protein
MKLAHGGVDRIASPRLALDHQLKASWVEVSKQETDAGIDAW